MKHIRKSLFCMLALLLMPACVFAINDLVTIRSNVMGYEDGDLVFDEATGDKTWSIKNVRAYGVGRYWSLTPETFVDRYGQQGVRIPSEFNVEEIHFTITSKFKVDGEIEVGEKFAELYLSSGNNRTLPDHSGHTKRFSQAIQDRSDLRVSPDGMQLRSRPHL